MMATVIIKFKIIPKISIKSIIIIRYGRMNQLEILKSDHQTITVIEIRMIE